jgi:hypothetical protein
MLLSIPLLPPLPPSPSPFPLPFLLPIPSLHPFPPPFPSPFPPFPFPSLSSFTSFPERSGERKQEDNGRQWKKEEEKGNKRKKLTEGGGSQISYSGFLSFLSKISFMCFRFPVLFGREFTTNFPQWLREAI